VLGGRPLRRSCAVSYLGFNSYRVDPPINGTLELFIVATREQYLHPADPLLLGYITELRDLL